STCFGAPFMALRPEVYANLLMNKIKQHKPSCWLLNTGWSGKPYGEGERIKIAYSRALIKAILSGDLQKGEFDRDPIFGFMIPRACPEVPSDLLNPRTNSPDAKAYEERAKRLAHEFKENFKQFGEGIPKEVKEVL
ncbi:MAG: phosphoenolpyruvate carboxykinase (ATP), partial [Candidatus Thorarchaeota archaeon]